MRIATSLREFLLATSVVVTQFYVFESGLPQPAHVLLFLFVLWTLVAMKARVKVGDQVGIYKWAAIFVIYGFIVNSIYSLTLQTYDFLVSSAYYAYGVTIALFITVSLNSSNNLNALVAKATVIGLLVLAVIYGAGSGRYIFFPRYNGFFNDPNQMAFWVLCSYAIFVLLSKNLLLTVSVGAVAIFLIVTTMSRSGSIGMLFVVAGAAINIFATQRNSRRLGLLLAPLIVLILVACASYVIYVNANDPEGQISSFIARFSEADVDEQADERGYGRIAAFPEYLVFGAGQGQDARFNSSNEIHSTWAGLLFYYGFIGLLIFLTFIGKIAKRLVWSQRLILAGPIFYGFFTFGLRAPVFWIFVGVVVHVIQGLESRHK